MQNELFANTSPRNCKCKTCGHPKPDFPKATEEQAEAIFDQYPRRTAPRRAIKAIVFAAGRIGRKDPNADAFGLLMEATKAYRKATTSWPDDAKPFIPHAASWFNGDCWREDRAEWCRGTAVSDSTQRANTGPDRLQVVSMVVYRLRDNCGVWGRATALQLIGDNLYPDEANGEAVQQALGLYQ